jgi:hypothetical protein
MSLRERFDCREPPWQILLRHAFDVALAHGEEDEAVAETLALSQHRRWLVAAARANCAAILAVSSGDRSARKAFALLDRTLREGDQRGCWRTAA